MAKDRILRCVIVTPEKAVLDEKADYVGLPMYDGDLGILPDHTPLIGRLGYGEITVRLAGVTKRFFLDGGFVQVRGDVVSVLTPKVLIPGEINLKAVEATLQEALTLARSPEEQEAKLKVQARARAQLRVGRQAQASTT